ncbi:MAG: transcriptional repressor [Candidatus Izimaplasma sp.]|nr:transcriptional repressor [Candidatus Izimaplasma bacterium]
MNGSSKEILIDKGISPSFTRVAIYNYLDINKNHPNIDTIYQKLSKKLPTLSKTTVYNVLNLFVEIGIVREVTTGSQEARYEIITKEHSHFKCDICNKIFDIPLVNTQHDINALNGFVVKEEVVILKGICPSCQTKH